MSKYLYQYVLELAKDPAHSHFDLYKFEILLENDEQYVIAIGNRYVVVDKNEMFRKWFRSKSWIWTYSHYYISLYTTEKGPKQIVRIKRALKHLIEENNFLSEVGDLDITAMLKDRSK